MPPILMLIGIAFVVIMVMMGHNPLDEIRAEREKYGRDPLAREINKFNEKNAKKNTDTRYRPPQGASVIQLPPEEAQIPVRKLSKAMEGEDEPLITPAPDIPIEQWGKQAYPNYMYAPQGGAGSPIPPNSIGSPRGGTSLMPGSGFTRQNPSN